MFGFKFRPCKRDLKQALSSCFEPLKDELGTVPVRMQTSKHITASMLGICEGYAEAKKIYKKQQLALITDAVFEEIFRRESTKVLTQVDQWVAEKDQKFMAQYQQAKSITIKDYTNNQMLNITWLQEYASTHFEPSNTLML